MAKVPVGRGGRGAGGALPEETRAILGATTNAGKAARSGLGGLLANAGDEARGFWQALQTPMGAANLATGFLGRFAVPAQVALEAARDPKALEESPETAITGAVLRSQTPVGLFEQSPGWNQFAQGARQQVTEALTAPGEVLKPGGVGRISKRSARNLVKMLKGIRQGFYDAPVASTLGFAAPVLHMASAHTPAANVADETGLVAYHGSPTKFPGTQNNPLGEFSLEHIGSGEGAQFYGYGQYLAESPSVAKTYMAQDKSKTFVSPRAISVGEKTFMNDRQLIEAAGNARNSSESAMYHILSTAYNLGIDTKPKLKAAIQRSPARFGAFSTSTKAFEDAVKMVMKKDVRLSSQEGHLYTVDLPDDHVSTMIDWDSPVSQQNPLVAKIASEQGITDGTGMDIYKSLSSSLGSDRAASEYLLSRGIRGLHYLDRTSRLMGVGTRNFVVFDPSIITITSRK